MSIIDDKDFKCPFCKSPLYISETKRIQTLIDHVSDPNGDGSMQEIYACSNKECKSNESDVLIRWDWYGDLYFFGENYERYREVEKSIVNDAPYGTSSRKSNIEIYKKGLKPRSFEVYPKWFLFNFGFFIEHIYEADYDGNVLKRKYKLKFLKKDGDMVIHYISGLYMFFWSIKNFKNKLELYRRNQHPSNKRDLLQDFEPLPQWDKRWYRKAVKFYINTFYSHIKKELTNGYEKTN